MYYPLTSTLLIFLSIASSYGTELCNQIKIGEYFIDHTKHTLKSKNNHNGYHKDTHVFSFSHNYNLFMSQLSEQSENNTPSPIFYKSKIF